MGESFHIAELNVVRMRAETLDDPLMHGFVSRLDEINALAERSPGFVWRLQTDEGDATAIRPFDDERILVNLTVWESVEALDAYVYGSDHGELVRHGRDWFERASAPQIVLWWIPAGQLPTLDEAKKRLELLRARGPSEEAFSFARRFPPAG